MPSPLPTLDSVFPPWQEICDKYDAICGQLHQQYPSPELASQKEESIHWEQTAFELILTLLVHLQISFTTSADNVQKIVKTEDGLDKEIDFSINIQNKEIYFGVTSFSDSPKDFRKDVDNTPIEIFDLKYPDGFISPTAEISSHRPHRAYLNRRLAVRVAREGKHRLDSDYIYIAFPKSDKGFGGGLDAIAKDFSITDSDYTYPTNGITGIVLIGEYLNIQPNRKFIEQDIWLVKSYAFPHASALIRNLLSVIDNVTINMRQRFEDAKNLLSNQ